MGELSQLAIDLDADERTLRRAVGSGTIRCDRPGPRRLELEEGERDYLRAHWATLSGLRRALRTEANVRLAVLYGSAARGDDGPDSDLDLLVSLARDTPDAAVSLAVRLERATGRAVDVARLDRVSASAPLLLLQAIDEGRPIVDRDGQWPDLLSGRAALTVRATRSHRRRRRQAAAAVAALDEE